jgi:hypothetical protein
VRSGSKEFHALNRIFESRYRGQTFPNDDAGLADLKILIHHYYWGNPIAMPRIIQMRAPWADVEAIIDEVSANPRKWSSEELGQELNFTGKEWRQLRIRTIAPVDMTKKERAYFNGVRADARRRIKRARSGMKTRAEYESQSLSQTKPWEAEGVGRRTWYRRQKENGRGTGLADIKITMDRPDLCQQGWDGHLVSVNKLREEGSGEAGNSPAPLPASPDPCQDPNFNPILSWLCVRAAYHQQMNKICDQAAVAA